MKKRIVRFVSSLAAILVLFSTLTFSVSASENKILDSGQIRFIKDDFWGTLSEHSVWKTGLPFKILDETLSNKLEDTSSCVQVWTFKADDFESIHNWCKIRTKGTQTNRDFLSEFGSFRVS